MTDNKHLNHKQPIEFEDSMPVLEQPEDFLSPEQRMKAIAEVLAAMALDVVRKRDDETTDDAASHSKKTQ